MDARDNTDSSVNAADVAVSAGTGHTTINLEFDLATQDAPPEFRNAIQTAANLLSAALFDPITINIGIGYGDVPFFNQVLPSGGAFGAPQTGIGIWYPSLRTQLITHASTPQIRAAVSALPDTASLNGVPDFDITLAEERALSGLAVAPDSTVDGDAGFATDIPLANLVGVALREMTHAMGRIAGPTALSLFKYRSAGQHDFESGPFAGPSYLSLDNGASKLADFGHTSNPADFLNPPDSNLTPEDPFNEFYDNNTLQSLTPIDLTTLGLLGFSTNNPPPPFTGFLQPTQASDQFGQSGSGGGWVSQDQYPRALAQLFTSDSGDDIIGFGAAGTFVATNNGGGNFSHPTLPPAIAAFGTTPAAGGWTSQDQFPREVAQVVPSTYPFQGQGGTGQGIAGFASNGVYIAPAILALDSHLELLPSFQTPTLASSFFGSSSAAGGWSSQNSYPRFLANVYGSGADDIVGFGSDGVYVAKNLDNGTFAAPTRVLSAFSGAQGWTSQDAYPRELADVNGDGLADIVGFGSDGTYVSQNIGNGQFTSPMFVSPNFGQSTSAGGWTSNDLYPRELADINGDGSADIVAFGATGVTYALGKSDGTFGPPTANIGNFGTSTPAGGWTSQNLYPRLLGDVTGDNKADIVGFGGTGFYVSAAS
jgi:hypothetical protein